MIWSRYNRLFPSRDSARSVYYLYNALTNTFFELDSRHGALVSGMRDRYAAASEVSAPESGPGMPATLLQWAQSQGPGTKVPEQGQSDVSGDAFTDALRAAKVLVEPGEEACMLHTLHYERLEISQRCSTLSLTICPTLACNFRCPYCFQPSDRSGFGRMSLETAERLLQFIRGMGEARAFTVAWYGGEPLLEWQTICELTGRFATLPQHFESASLVTNGYLLDSTRIARLNDLRITNIQFTIDGPAGIHDNRRRLPDGSPTFARIVENLDTLMASDYTGTVDIRVNTDRSNLHTYPELRSMLLGRYPRSRLEVYPGYVFGSEDSALDTCLGMSKWAAWNLDLYYKHGIVPRGSFFPRLGGGLCTATNRDGYVIGPQGEIYACWEDVGRPAMVMGSIYADHSITNPALRALYRCASDPYTDSVCKGCPVLPVCGGGCVHRRLVSHCGAASCAGFCTPLREHITEYLEAYADIVLSREICASLRGSGIKGTLPWQPAAGWRIISPRGVQNTAIPGAKGMDKGILEEI